VRKIVTGTQADGRSGFVIDEEISTSQIWVDIWGSDSPFRLPSDGSQPLYSSIFPPEGGVRTGLAIHVPEGEAESRLGMLRASVGNERLDAFADFEIGNDGMHITATVDIGIVLSGSVYLELEEGEEVLLCSGDVVIQNGTRHAWHNRGEVDCVMLVTIVGAAIGSDR
jgi:mannose-6-phosphate isomerase-like protein (cupin superfamily)